MWSAMMAENMTPDETADASGSHLSSALRAFIRTRGADFLNDPNISSIGVGYKVSEGHPTGDLALQFTVRQKAAPEALEALGTTMIPETIMIEGTPVPTDVLQRTYEPSYRVVPEVQPPRAKVRADPILPGVSVSHIKGTAGTIGCIVYDKTDGAPLILSNWHVLHGPEGALGDVIVQPGPYDDNRIDRNRLGVLKRSYLGVAGDCAVATIVDRGFVPEILGIDIAPDQLGEPELGDHVLKSGRTTGITYGVVRRVDVIVKLSYGMAGEHTIGCFEIGTDPDHPAQDNEISKGGDSGSIWLFGPRDGQPSTIMAGLHFAGETASDPDEHALACLPQSVFEKLDITLHAPGPEQVSGTVAEGYDPQFLAQRVPVPALREDLRADSVTINGSEVIPYTHFSLVLSMSRCLARWVAWNIDGGHLRRLPRKNIDFLKDPRIPAQFQTGNELYTGNRLDRGHIARRADLLWGTAQEAALANTDSFFFTNITPQKDDFNQSSRNGIWGQLEDAVFADVDVDDLKVSVFGGPVFHDDDRRYRGTAIPREFWKVVVFVEHGKLRTSAFLLTQNLDRLEALDLDEFRVYQVTISALQERTQISFPVELHSAGTFMAPASVSAHRPLTALSDIQW
jgi:endonuclease G